MIKAPSPSSSFQRKLESIFLLFGRSRWIRRASWRAPFGPFAARMFASASCLRGPAYAGMTALLFSGLLPLAIASEEEEPVERTYVATPAAPAFQSWDDAGGTPDGCV